MHGGEGCIKMTKGMPQFDQRNKVKASKKAKVSKT